MQQSGKPNLNRKNRFRQRKKKVNQGLQVLKKSVKKSGVSKKCRDRKQSMPLKKNLQAVETLDPFEANKRALREQRFSYNVVNDESKLLARQARFGLTNAIVPVDVTPEEREKRKKRALRFETSNLDLENEKKKDRQLRFGTSSETLSSITNQSWEARVAARTLRFGKV